MSKHVMVIAELYKLAKYGNKFTKEQKILVREKSLVPRGQVARINNEWEACGKWYEVYEKETEKVFEEGEAKVKAIKVAQEDSDALGKVMADTLKSVKKKKVKKVDTTPDINEELEAAKDRYEELFGERPHHMAQLKGINKKIAEKEAELSN